MLALKAIILTGGMSRRMGEDKAFLPHNMQTFVEHQVSSLLRVGFDDIVISCCNRQKKKLSDLFGAIEEVSIIADSKDYNGALFAVNKILSSSASKAAVVIPVDMPEVSTYISEVYDFLNSCKSDIVCVKDALFPFFILNVAEFIKSAYEAEKNSDRSFHGLLDCLSHTVLTVPKPYSNKLVNINTKKDYQIYSTPFEENHGIQTI